MPAFPRISFRCACSVLVLCSFGWLCPPVQAETAYVIDQLLAGIREGTKVTDKVLRVVPTGTRLDVLEQNGAIARVRTEDGLEGWIDAGYLMEQPPAALRIVSLQETLAETQDQLHRLQQSGDKDRQASVPAVDDPTSFGGRLIFSLGAMLAGSCAGFFIGLSWQSRRERRKLAGYRI